jgi:hypothetical protein
MGLRSLLFELFPDPDLIESLHNFKLKVNSVHSKDFQYYLFIVIGLY